MNDLKPYVGRRILITTDVADIDGTLERAGKDMLQLGAANLVGDDGGRRPIDGTALIPCSQVRWIQVP